MVYMPMSVLRDAVFSIVVVRLCLRRARAVCACKSGSVWWRVECLFDRLLVRLVVKRHCIALHHIALSLR